MSVAVDAGAAPSVEGVSSGGMERDAETGGAVRGLQTYPDLMWHKRMYHGRVLC